MPSLAERLEVVHGLVAGDAAAVTYTTLAYQLGVPSLYAKQLLFAYAEQAGADAVVPLFTLTTASKAGGTQVRLVAGREKLDAAMAEAELVVDVSVFSLQKAVPSDARVLYKEDMSCLLQLQGDSLELLRSLSLSGINNEAYEHMDKPALQGASYARTQSDEVLKPAASGGRLSSGGKSASRSSSAGKSGFGSSAGKAKRSASAGASSASSFFANVKPKKAKTEEVSASKAAAMAAANDDQDDIGPDLPSPVKRPAGKMVLEDDEEESDGDDFAPAKRPKLANPEAREDEDEDEEDDDEDDDEESDYTRELKARSAAAKALRKDEEKAERAMERKAERAAAKRQAQADAQAAREQAEREEKEAKVQGFFGGPAKPAAKPAPAAAPMVAPGASAALDQQRRRKLVTKKTRDAKGYRVTEEVWVDMTPEEIAEEDAKLAKEAAARPQPPAAAPKPAPASKPAAAAPGKKPAKVAQKGLAAFFTKKPKE